ncbi:hypothetical protein [Spirosoma litoris]
MFYTNSAGFTGSTFTIIAKQKAVEIPDFWLEKIVYKIIAYFAQAKLATVGNEI